MIEEIIIIFYHKEAEIRIITTYTLKKMKKLMLELLGTKVYLSSKRYFY